MHWLYLGIAILAEVIGTLALRESNSFRKLIPSIIVVVGYAASFYIFSFILNAIPAGVAYAIWSGVGIVLIALAGYFLYEQKLDMPALIGMGMIVGGILIMNLFSNSVNE